MNEYKEAPLIHCIDEGELEVIGTATIEAAEVELLRCKKCGKVFDISQYESIANAEDCVEIRRRYYYGL